MDAKAKVFARTWNVMTVASNAAAISDILDRGVIDSHVRNSGKWKALLVEEPKIICALDETDPIYGSRYYHVDLPEGWGWSAADGVVTLKDSHGTVRYTKEYKSLRF